MIVTRHVNRINLKCHQFKPSSEPCSYRASYICCTTCLNTRGYLRRTWFQPSTLRGLIGKENSSAPPARLYSNENMVKRKGVIAVVLMDGPPPRGDDAIRERKGWYRSRKTKKRSICAIKSVLFPALPSLIHRQPDP